MPAYVISEVAVLDEEQGQRYRELAAASIARYGGRYLVRGAEPEVPEGDWPAAHRVVVVEFPTMQRLRSWYASTEYAQALAVRQTALTRRLLFVDGVEQAQRKDPSMREVSSRAAAAACLSARFAVGWPGHRRRPERGGHRRPESWVGGDGDVTESGAATPQGEEPIDGVGGHDRVAVDRAVLR